MTMSTSLIRLFVVIVAFAILSISYKRAASYLPAKIVPNTQTTPVLVASSQEEVVSPPPDSSLLQDDDDYELANRESFGFFNDVPERHWLLRKKIAKNRIHLSVDAQNVPQTYYQNNWNPEFSCEMEDYVGRAASSGKWVCDPHRLNRPGCLVYAVAFRGGFQFEQHLSEIAPLCEIHSFSYDDMSEDYNSRNITNNGAFHNWGIVDEAGAFFSHMKHNRLQRDRYKTLTQSMQDLGHAGRTLNAVVMVCEMCEFYAYKEWLQLDIRQLMLKVHFTTPNTTDMFQALHDAGYANFHKEPFLNRGGRHIEFSFLKLQKSFLDG